MTRQEINKEINKENIARGLRRMGKTPDAWLVDAEDDDYSTSNYDGPIPVFYATSIFRLFNDIYLGDHLEIPTLQPIGLEGNIIDQDDVRKFYEGYCDV